MARGRSNRTPKKREKLLAKLRLGWSVGAAARAAVMSRQSAYDWRHDDPEFRRDWDAAVEEGTDLLEDEALKQARQGNHVLTIFLLKGRRPERYRERLGIDFAAASDEQIESALSRMSADQLRGLLGRVAGNRNAGDG